MSDEPIDDTIRFNCPECNRLLLAPPQYAGRQILCPDCRARATVPRDRSQDIATEPLPSRAEPLVAEPVEERRARLRPEPMENLPPVRKSSGFMAGIFGSVLGVLFLVLLVGGGIAIGWWQSKNKMIKPIKDGLAGQGIQADTVTLDEQPDGTWRGLVVDKQGQEWELARVWKRTQPGQQEMIYWVVRPKDQVKMNDWYKTKLQPTVEEPIKTIEAKVQTKDNSVRGTFKTASGILHEFWEEMDNDPTKNMIRWQVAESAYADWLKMQIDKKNKIKLETLTIKKVRDKHWEGEGKTKEGFAYRVTLERGQFTDPKVPVAPGNKVTEQFRWWVTPK